MATGSADDAAGKHTSIAQAAEDRLNSLMLSNVKGGADQSFTLPKFASEGTVGETISDYERILRAALDSEDGVKTGTPLGQRFQRRIRAEKDLAKTYNKCDGYEKQREFRKEWAKDELKAEEAKRTKTELTRSMEANKGIYRPFSVIVAKEGGDLAAVEAATKLCEKAIKLGGKYVKYNWMTERTEYLHLRGELVDEFIQEWKKEEDLVSTKKEGDTETQIPPKRKAAAAKTAAAKNAPGKDTNKKAKKGAAATTSPNQKLKSSADELIAANDKTKASLYLFIMFYVCFLKNTHIYMFS